MKNQAPKQHNPHYAENMVNSKLLKLLSTQKTTRHQFSQNETK